MNNKGFTTVEVIISFSLIVIIMVSMTSMLVSYRDTISTEEVKTRLVEFKNSFTYMVYEDIVYNGINGVRYCDTSGESATTNGKCVDFIKDGEAKYRLELIEDVASKNSEGATVYKTFLDYRGIRVMLPDSDLNVIKTTDQGVDNLKQVAVIYDFIIPSDDSQYGVTSLTIPFEHHGIDYRDNIKIVITK